MMIAPAASQSRGQVIGIIEKATDLKPRMASRKPISGISAATPEKFRAEKFNGHLGG
jgi:hypothetical protein